MVKTRIWTAALVLGLLLSLPAGCQVEDVEGDFHPTAEVGHKRRVYGVLRTHDAEVKVGFDADKVRLPSGACRMVVSGKLWLNERGGDLTIMVSSFTELGALLGTGAISA